MYFEHSEIYKHLRCHKLELSFGTYYLCDHFFLSEINNGEHIDIKKANILLEHLYTFYGEGKQLAYIANRMNSYSVDPSLWDYFKERFNLVAASIVCYRDSTYLNANIEKQFASISLKRAQTLEESITWVKNLREFN